MGSINFGRIKVAANDLKKSIKEIEGLCSTDTIGGSVANWTQIKNKLRKATEYLDDVDEIVDKKEAEYNEQDNKGKS